MKTVYIVRNKEDRRIQTGWYDESSANQQAQVTQSEMEAEGFPEEECGYEVVGPVHIQDSASPNLEFDDGWWILYGGKAVTKVENAAKVIADKAGVDILTALDYIREVIKDRIS